MEGVALGTVVFYGLMGLTGLFLLIVFFASWYTVEQQTKAVIERFGRFVRVATPGLNFKIPLIEKVAGRPNLKTQQLSVAVDTITKDKVSVKVVVSVQYYVIAEKVYEAFYKLAEPTKQITSYVFDVVRANVPKQELDEVFEKKDEVGKAVKDHLAGVMDDYGFGITTALVTDIDPDSKVKEAMNDINAAQRQRVAAQERGEAEKILKVKHAEGEAASKALQGKGIADQRMAIINGLRESIEMFKAGVPGVSEHDVMQMVLLTQYFDTLKEIGASNRSTTILLPHSPSSVKDLGDQIRDGMIAATQIKDGVDVTDKEGVRASA